MLCAAIACAAAAAQDYTLDWWTVDSGGDMWSTGGTLELSGAAGQPDTDATLTMTGTTLSLTGGFWAGVTTTAPIPGDCTGDGVVDLDDFEIIAPCLTGPDISIAVGCDCADLDGDGDSDLADFAAFQREFDPQ
jgi:hypothetical protein